MKLDDLKQDWQQAIETESTPDNLTEVIDMIEQQTTKVDKEIKRPLSRELLFGKLKTGGSVTVNFVNNEFVLECKEQVVEEVRDN